jgi:hypothetical protein
MAVIGGLQEDQLMDSFILLKEKACNLAKLHRKI